MKVTYISPVSYISYLVAYQTTLKQEMTSLLEGMQYVGINEALLITANKVESVETNGKKL